MEICQSCGMPLDHEKVFGVNEDGSRNDMYCIYCYNEGKFTSDCTMDEMIEVCTKIMVEEEKMNITDAKKMMESIIPGLKRWK